MALCYLDRVPKNLRRIAAIIRDFHGAGIGADNCTLWPVCFTTRKSRAAVRQRLLPPIDSVSDAFVPVRMLKSKSTRAFSRAVVCIWGFMR
jgi:hypothetical protein